MGQDTQGLFCYNSLVYCSRAGLGSVLVKTDSGLYSYNKNSIHLKNRNISFSEVAPPQERTTLPHTPRYKFMYGCEDKSTNFPQKKQSTNIHQKQSVNSATSKTHLVMDFMTERGWCSVHISY